MSTWKQVQARTGWPAPRRVHSGEIGLWAAKVNPAKRHPRMARRQMSCGAASALWTRPKHNTSSGLMRTEDLAALYSVVGGGACTRLRVCCRRFAYTTKGPPGGAHGQARRPITLTRPLPQIRWGRLISGPALGWTGTGNLLSKPGLRQSATAQPEAWPPGVNPASGRGP